MQQVRGLDDIHQSIESSMYSITKSHGEKQEGCWRAHQSSTNHSKKQDNRIDIISPNKHWYASLLLDITKGKLTSTLLLDTPQIVSKLKRGKPGTKALAEIRAYQRTTELLIPRFGLCEPLWFFWNDTSSHPSPQKIGCHLHVL